MDAPTDPRLLLLWDIYSTDRDDPNEVREDLKEMGYDLDLLTRRGNQLFREIQGRVKLEIEAHHTQTLSARAERLRERLREQLQTERDPKAALLSMLSRTTQEGQTVFFRKIESLSVEDALEILSDAQLLKMFEEDLNTQIGDDTHMQEEIDE